MTRTAIISTLLAAAALVLPSEAFSQNRNKAADRETEAYRYEVEQVSVAATSGDLNLCVYSYSAKPFVAEEQSKKNAIHACVFKGIPECPSKPGSAKKPLLMDAEAEAEHADWLDDFFAAGGEFMRFVVITDTRLTSVMQLKKEYKVGVRVTVKYNDLRKYLEDNKIIKSLSSALENAKKPIIMVVPDDQWCKANGYVTVFDDFGTKKYIPDYQAALEGDAELGFVVSKLGEQMSERGFELKLLSQALQSLRNTEAEDMVMTSKDGAEMAESDYDRLKKTAKADILMKVNWKMEKFGSQNTVAYNLYGVDAYTDTQIAASSGVGSPSYNPSAAALLIEAVNIHIDQYASQLLAHFNGYSENGRPITIECLRWDDCPIDYETEIESTGDELGVMIEDWLAENAVKGSFSTTMATENKMVFEQVRMPMSMKAGSRERAVDARYFTRGLVKMMSEATGLECKVATVGLGKVRIYLGGK